MWTTDNTVVVILSSLNILLWILPLALNRSIQGLLEDLKVRELEQVQLRSQARLRVKLQFSSIIFCLVTMSVTQITVICCLLG